MSHKNRLKPVMTQNGKTAVMIGIFVGASIFMLVPSDSSGASGFGFGLMLFSMGILVAHQLPLWQFKTRAEDSILESDA